MVGAFLYICVMSSVKQLYHKFKELSAGFASVNASSEIGNAIKNTEQWMVELNKEQLSHGINSLGQKLMPYNSLTYALRKEEMNPLPGFGVPDLKYTGAFYGGLFAKYQGGKIVFGSTDSKTDELRGKYGVSIFGLTKENEQFYKDNILREEIIKIVERKTGLKAR